MKMDAAKQGAVLAHLAGLHAVRGCVIVPTPFVPMSIPLAKAIHSSAVVNRAVATLGRGGYADFLKTLRDIGGWDHFPSPTIGQLLESDNAIKAEAVLRVCGKWEEEKKPAQPPVPDLDAPFDAENYQLYCGVDGYVRVKDGRTFAEYINDSRLVEQRRQRRKMTPLVCISVEAFNRLRASEKQLATLCGAIAGALEEEDDS